MGKKRLGIAVFISVVAVLVILLIGNNRAKISKLIPFDDVNSAKWESDFKKIQIKSSADGTIQSAYFYKSTSTSPQPLVISLHTWSGDYTQDDKIKEQVKSKNWNYIHPDFRGPNNTVKACVSSFVISDIDDAIAYSISHSNVDTSKIYVVGTSGGGYATLAVFMKSKYNIAHFSAWCAISDLEAWYNESKIRKSNYVDDILKCTNGLDKEINLQEVRLRSPLRWETPIEKLNDSKLQLYAGVFDGIDGSVPVIHSINFYNKVLRDLDCSDEKAFISDSEIVELIGKIKPVGEHGTIGNRKIFLKKEYGNVSIVIFEGGHEMLTDVVLETF